MKNKHLVGFFMRIIGTMGLGLVSGWLIRDFGPKTLWYTIGIVTMIAAILFGLYLERN